MDPKVSIITPTFNRKGLLRNTIASVLKQTFQEWEQIVLDDGSTDGTDEIVARIHDPRVIYIRQRHLGIDKLGESYNKILRECRAPLVAVLEDDDWWPREKLATQTVHFRNAEVVLSYGRALYVDYEGKVIRGPNLWLNWPKRKSILFNDPPGTILRQLLFEYFIPSTTVMIRKSTLDEVGGFIQPPGFKAVDFATWAALSLRGKFAPVSRILAYVRRHPGSTTIGINSEADENLLALLNSVDYSKRFLMEQAARGFLRRELWYLIDEASKYRRIETDRAEFAETRRLLLRGDWSKARMRLRTSMKSESLKIRFAAICAFLSSYLKTDMEKIVQLYGAAPLV